MSGLRSHNPYLCFDMALETDNQDNDKQNASLSGGRHLLRWAFIRVVHLAIFFFSLFCSFMLRYDFRVFPNEGETDWLGRFFLPVFVFIVIMKYFVFRYFGLFFRGFRRTISPGFLSRCHILS